MTLEYYLTTSILWYNTGMKTLLWQNPRRQKWERGGMSGSWKLQRRQFLAHHDLGLQDKAVLRQKHYNNKYELALSFLQKVVTAYTPLCSSLIGLNSLVPSSLVDVRLQQCGARKIKTILCRIQLTLQYEKTLSSNMLHSILGYCSFIRPPFYCFLAFLFVSIISIPLRCVTSFLVLIVRLNTTRVVYPGLASPSLHEARHTHSQPNRQHTQYTTLCTPSYRLEPTSSPTSRFCTYCAWRRHDRRHGNILARKSTWQAWRWHRWPYWEL